MNLQFMMRDAQPNGVWDARDVEQRLANGVFFERPVVVRVALGEVLRNAERLCSMLPYGSVIVHSLETLLLSETLRDAYKWREWRPAGVDADEVCYVRAHVDNTYTSHQGYLRRAVELTTGPVMELGMGEGSTPMLHEMLAGTGRHLVSLDSDAAWVEKYKPLQSSTHLIEYEKDPASIVVNTSTFFPGVRQGVIFIDHAPGETRHVALDRARTLADYVVIHDAEDYGYGLERVFKTYKHVRKFRYMRPWTAVCSDARPIFSSPYPEDGP